MATAPMSSFGIFLPTARLMKERNRILKLKASLNKTTCEDMKSDKRTQKRKEAYFLSMINLLVLKEVIGW